MSNKRDRKQSSVARKRWALLARSLTKSHKRKASELCYSAEDEVSIRRFEGFGIFHYDKEREDELGIWYWVKNAVIMANTDLKIRLLYNKIDAEILIGFNNTGNICIWPSEELLAYYCLKNKEKFRFKKVCELGGGMTALAGLCLAAESEGKEFHLTDGNRGSSLNIQEIVKQNLDLFGSKKVIASQLLWGKDQMQEDHDTYNYVICADCCYFVEYQQQLIDTIFLLLKDEGEAIIFAPKRGSTFDEFTKLAKTSFEVTISEKYDKDIWHKHQVYMKLSSSYQPDIHYPLMIVMQKRGSKTKNP